MSLPDYSAILHLDNGRTLRSYSIFANSAGNFLTLIISEKRGGRPWFVCEKVTLERPKKKGKPTQDELRESKMVEQESYQIW